MFVAIDRTSKFAFAELHDKAPTQVDVRKNRSLYRPFAGKDGLRRVHRRGFC